jgi:hypothetical protein
MHFSTAISLLVGATCVASFHIPSNVTDGVYSVFTHENGTEVHTRIGDLLDPNINTLVPSSKFKRQNTDWTTTTCYPQEGTQDLDHRTCDAANATLDAQVGFLLYRFAVFFCEGRTPGSCFKPYHDFHILAY